MINKYALFSLFTQINYLWQHMGNQMQSCVFAKKSQTYTASQTFLEEKAVTTFALGNPRHAVRWTTAFEM